MANDRCILWTARGQAPSPDLVGALSRKGIDVEPCTSPYEAIARLCVVARSPERRASKHAAVLLLCDPETLDRAAEVAQLAERYADGSVLWVYASGTGRLRSATTQEAAAWSKPEVKFGPAVREIKAAQAVAPRPAPMPTPKAPPRPSAPLRLSGRGTLPPTVDDSAEATPRPTPDKAASHSANGHAEPGRVPPGLLSDEELEMLLSPDDPPRQD